MKVPLALSIVTLLSYGLSHACTSTPKPTAENSKATTIWGTMEEELYDGISRMESIDEAADQSFYEAVSFEGSTADDDYDILLVAAGGWNSCKPGPYGQPLMPYIQHLRQKIYDLKKLKSRFLFTCLTKYGKRFYYYSTTTKTKLSYGLMPEIVRVVEAEAAKTKNKKLYIVGFSYGGWLSLNITNLLSSMYKIVGLATIDAISIERCRPSDIAAWYYRNYRTRTFQNECQNAPTDLAADNLKNIAAKAGWWTHFYQTDSHHLHSSEITEAHKNVPIELKGDGSESIMGHGRILHDLRVWDSIEASVLGLNNPVLDP